MLKLEIKAIEEINNAAQIFVEYLSKNFVNVSCFAFYGKMGSGKTTFIKALCKKLNVINEVTSPTFAIINEYSTSEAKILYHFDFYRINKLNEALDIGCEDYFFSGNICFIEWPELIEQILPENHLKIFIEIIDNNTRTITVE